MQSKIHLLSFKVNPPERATAQWSDKGSYRAEHVLKYVESLLTIPIHFVP